MEYKKFLETVQEQVLSFLPNEYRNAQVSIHQVMKNNDTALDAVVIRNGQESVTPHIYLADLFAEHQKGMPMETVMKNIAQIFQEHQNPEIPDVAAIIKDIEKVKELVIVQLINKENNQESLAHTPHWDMENTDLTAVLRIQVTTSERDTGTILVSDQMLSSWNTDADMLYQQALSNTMEQSPAKVASLMEIMFSMQGEGNPWQELQDCKMEPYDQYVLSNTTTCFGASVLLYPDVMNQLAQNAGDNLFILPSSIHELIIMRDTGEMSAEELQAMVACVNQEEVDPQEVLSDEVYYYNKDEHSLTMATSKEHTAALKSHLELSVSPEPVQEAEFEREA